MKLLQRLVLLLTVGSTTVWVLTIYYLHYHTLNSPQTMSNFLRFEAKEISSKVLLDKQSSTKRQTEKGVEHPTKEITPKTSLPNQITTKKQTKKGVEQPRPKLKVLPVRVRVPGFSSDVYLNFDTRKYIDEKGRITIPPVSVLQNMSLDEVEELYYRYIENIQVVCPRTRHIGNDDDGGYVVCEPSLPNNCLAYSFGNRRDYSFDDGLAFHYNCEVHSFDPNDGQPDHRHSQLVEFHKLGIGGQDEVTRAGWKLKTLDSIRKLLGHEERSIDLLKIDIEGGEWNSLDQILRSNTLEKAFVKLLIVEFHMAFTTQDLEAYLHGLHILREIYNAGYRLYYFRMWSGGGCRVTNKKTRKQRATCHEAHFMKV